MRSRRRKVRATAPKKAQVSSLGRFRSTYGVVTTPARRKDGYAQVTIGKKRYAMHRLVAFAFGLPREPGQNTVDHINGTAVEYPDGVDNLRFATQAQQMQYSYANKNRRSNAPRQSKPVRGRKVGDVAWTAYDSVNDAARRLEVNLGSVSKCCSGKRKQTGGYEFELATPTEPELLPEEEWRDVVFE